MKTDLLVALAAAAAIWIFSVWFGHVRDQAREQGREEIRTAYELRLKEAGDYIHQRERTFAEASATRDAEFERTRQHEKAIHDRAVSDLLRDNKRLQVAVRAATGTGLRGAAPAAGGGDGQALATLTGPVAARLAGRYADYNALITQLEECQATVQAQYEQTRPR